ncbi:hypothetical protein LPUS_09976 [Lasallia pustulata]|uniref:MARVEL domain-containing protein n=1 Tax=Lasallia pustulata TaxID=136370 RepID=A0A1W5D942_9LECA|nr:hypothetical protein LPUS_09976 [Lasallia pustulata]
MPLQAETRRNLYEGDPKWPVKLTLRAAATFFAFFGMTLFAVATSLTNKNFINLSGGGDWTDGMTLAPITLSFLYNPIVISILLFVRRGRTIHPAWHVVMDLIIWGLCVPCIVFSVDGGLFWAWVPTQYSDDGTVNCDFYNWLSRPCLPVLYTIGGLEIAGIVFLFLIFVLHLTLFVFACIDTKKWRSAAKRAKSPEEHQAHQPPAYTPSAEGSGVMADSAVK